MLAIFRIGRNCYPYSPERIFAHQLGDGFLVISDFAEESLERAVTIAVALMQHVAASGRFSKSAIAEGELSDIQGCYPREVLDELESDQTVSLIMGLMTIFPVMGTALIRSMGIAKSSPKGPLLLIEKSKDERLPGRVPTKAITGTELLSIDWVHMETDLLRSLQYQAGLPVLSAQELESRLARYCQEHNLPDEWKHSVNSLLSVRVMGEIA